MFSQPAFLDKGSQPRNLRLEATIKGIEMNKLNKFYPRKQLMDIVIRIFNDESTGSKKKPFLNAFPQYI
jgi:hypothetical protein